MKRGFCCPRIVRIFTNVVVLSDKWEPAFDRLRPRFGRSAAEIGQTWQWIMGFDNHLQGALSTVVRALFRGEVDGRWEEVSAAAGVMEGEFKLIEGELGERPYLLGEKVGAADVVLYPAVQWLRRALDIAPAPQLTPQIVGWLAECVRLRGWEQQIQTLPNYERTYPPHWRESG